MSSPIYTSEAIDNVNPRWSSLEVPIIYATSYSTANGKFYIYIIISTQSFAHSYNYDNQDQMCLFLQYFN